MRRTVRIHGFSLEPITLEIVAETALEIIESIGRQVPELQSDWRTGPKRVQIVDHRTLEELMTPLKSEIIDVVPDFTGNKSGLGQILLGGLLVALSFVPGIGTFAAGILMKVGAMLILGGLSQLLNPTPKLDGDNDNTKSRYLGPPKTTVASGTRIPILVGHHRVGGHFLSYDINARLVRPIIDD